MRGRTQKKKLGKHTLEKKIEVKIQKVAISTLQSKSHKTIKMNAKVLEHLQKCVKVEDPYPYVLGRQVRNSIVDRKPFMVAFFEGSVAVKEMSQDLYWKRVEYDFLPKKQPLGHQAFYRSSTPLVWFEFQAKHAKLVN